MAKRQELLTFIAYKAKFYNLNKGIGNQNSNKNGKQDN